MHFRTNVLSFEEWVCFNHLLFSNMKLTYSKSMNNRPVDMNTLLTMRKYLDDTYPWGWLIRGNKLPKKAEARDLAPVKRVHTLKRQQYKDKIYQMWRAKYNNLTARAAPKWKEKMRLQREKLNTIRRMPKMLKQRSQNGEIVSPFGTLVGLSDFLSCPRTTKEDYTKVISRMSKEGESEVFLAKELVRLWDVHYSVISGKSGQALFESFKLGNLVAFSRFRWYEAYANKICQLPTTSKSDFLENLYSIGAHMAELFAYSNVSYIPNTDHNMEVMTCCCILSGISRLLGETSNFVLPLDKATTETLEEVREAVESRKVCNAIINYDYHNASDGDKDFGVASLGVPFIKGITEEEAAYVFATSSDVFFFNPDQTNGEKCSRIYLLNEFLRRHVLNIRDFTRNNKSELACTKFLSANWHTLRGRSRGETRQQALRGLQQAKTDAQTKKQTQSQSQSQSQSQAYASTSKKN